MGPVGVSTFPQLYTARIRKVISLLSRDPSMSRYGTWLAPTLSDSWQQLCSTSHSTAALLFPDLPASSFPWHPHVTVLGAVSGPTLPLVAARIPLPTQRPWLSISLHHSCLSLHWVTWVFVYQHLSCHLELFLQLELCVVPSDGRVTKAARHMGTLKSRNCQGILYPSLTYFPGGWYPHPAGQ